MESPDYHAYVTIIKYGPRAGMESESKLTEAVAGLSDAELSEI